MFRNVIRGNKMQLMPRDGAGPAGMGQRFGAEKTGAAAPERKVLCHAANIAARCACSRSLYSETRRAGT